MSVYRRRRGHPYGGGSGVYAAANGAEFDGTNDYLTRSGNLGASNTKLWCGSFWINKTAGTGTAEYVFKSNLSNWVRFTGDTANARIQVRAQGTSTGEVLRMQSSSINWETGSWINVMWSVDLTDASKCFLYIDDADDTSLIIRVDETINFNGVTSTGIAADPASGALKLQGCLQEYWMAMGQWLDLSVVSERRKLFDATGKPADLGSDGSTPTGVAPNIYLKDPFGSFESNYGSGGDFTVTGALADCGSSPSD